MNATARARPPVPCLMIGRDGDVQDLMPEHVCFWSGEGCTVRKDGPMIRGLVKLARRTGINVIVPRTDRLSAAEVVAFGSFKEAHLRGPCALASLNPPQSPASPVVQIAQDDGIFEHGLACVTGKVAYYRDLIDLRTPWAAKEAALYWAGGFSGTGRRWRLVERLSGLPRVNVRMVDRWSHEAPEFVRRHPGLIVPLEPPARLGLHQKLLVMDGNGVGGNATLNALLDAVYVFHGELFPMWMHSAAAGRHYLRMMDDFSNLAEILRLLDDPERCAALRHDLRAHMAAFLDAENVLRTIAEDMDRASQCDWTMP